MGKMSGDIMKSTCSIFLIATIICTNTCRVQSADESGIWPQDLGHQLRLRSDDQWPQDLTHQLRLRSDDQWPQDLTHQLRLRSQWPSDLSHQLRLRRGFDIPSGSKWSEEILSPEESDEKRGPLKPEFSHPFMRNFKRMNNRFVRLRRDPEDDPLVYRYGR